MRDSSHARFDCKSSLPVFADNGSLLLPCEQRLHFRGMTSYRENVASAHRVRCFSHASANCEMQIPNYLYSENGCCQETITTPAIAMTYYWIYHLLLKRLTSRNAPIYLTHRKPDNGHAHFRIEGAFRLFNFIYLFSFA